MLEAWVRQASGGSSEPYEHKKLVGIREAEGPKGGLLRNPYKVLRGNSYKWENNYYPNETTRKKLTQF